MRPLTFGLLVGLGYLLWRSSVASASEASMWAPGILTPADKQALIEQQAALLGIEPAVAKAILQIESGGSGYHGGRVTIRFEPGTFNSVSRRKAMGVGDDVPNFDLANLSRKGQDGEYNNLALAIAIDPNLAFNSISVGASQIMGFNAKSLGYKSAKDMFDAFQASEAAQIMGFFQYVAVNKLVNAARDHDWLKFARGYNGSGQVGYDTKLEDLYNKMTA